MGFVLASVSSRQVYRTWASGCQAHTVLSLWRNGLAGYFIYFLILEYPSEKVTLEDRKRLEQSATQGVWFFLASYTKQKSGINQNLCELPSVEVLLTPMAPAPAPRQGGCSPAPLYSAALGFPSCPVTPCTQHSWLGDALICHPPRGARPPTASAWESSQLLMACVITKYVEGLTTPLLQQCHTLLPSSLLCHTSIFSLPSCNVLQTPPSQGFHSPSVIEEGIQKWRCRERKDIGMEKRGTLRVRERCGLVIWDHRSVERFLVSELRGTQLGWHAAQHQPWTVVLSQPNPFPCVSPSCHPYREKQPEHSDWNVSIDIQRTSLSLRWVLPCPDLQEA